MAAAVNKKGANWVLSLWTNAAGSAFQLMAHYNDAYLAGLRTHQIFFCIIGPNGSVWLFMRFFFFLTAYCLFKLSLHCAKGSLKVTTSWHGHDNMTDSKTPAPSVCGPRFEAPWGRRCPFPLQHMSLCQLGGRGERKKVKLCSWWAYKSEARTGVQ